MIFWFLFVAVCLTLFFAAVAFRNYFVRPYVTAAARVRQMSQGNFHDELPPTSIEEAGELFRSVNKLSKELEAQSKMMAKLERMRIDFVANVSHELKTPLTSIKGYTETLKGGALTDPQVGPQFLERIEENTDRLTAIISDLLLLSHVESFPGDVQWKTIETSGIAKKLDATFMPTLEKKHQTLTTHFDDPQIEGDPKKLEHVFINLTDNAIRYCQNGATIALKQTKDTFHWIVEISDNGPGIPPEHQSRIFERFYRVDADRSRDTGGTGLGLSIVKHILMLHDGTIDLKSEPGQGTHFYIRWPRRQL